MPKRKNHRQIKELEYDFITDGVWIGTNQCCEKHFEKELIRKGMTADISLEGKQVDSPFGVEVYVWLPVKDHSAPTPDQLAFGVSIIEALVKAKKNVYVHCKNGHGRAPTLVAAYLIKKGRGVSQAIKFVESKRSGAHIEPPQAKALLKFAGQVLREHL